MDLFDRGEHAASGSETRLCMGGLAEGLKEGTACSSASTLARSWFHVCTGFLLEKKHVPGYGNGAEENNTSEILEAETSPAKYISGSSSN